MTPRRVRRSSPSHPSRTRLGPAGGGRGALLALLLALVVAAGAAGAACGGGGSPSASPSATPTKAVRGGPARRPTIVILYSGARLW